ncbi:MAG TPA: metallophosphoesterase, partial [Chitinophagaceae bacterium]
MRFRFGSLIFLAVMLLIDLYVFQAVRTVLVQASPKTRTVIYIVYAGVCLAGLLLVGLFPFLHYDRWPKTLRSVVFALIIGLFLAELLVAVFLLADDIRRGVQWIAEKIISAVKPRAVPAVVHGITRSQFLTRMGLVLGGSLYATLIYGF